MFASRILKALALTTLAFSLSACDRWENLHEHMRQIPQIPHMNCSEVTAEFPYLDTYQLAHWDRFDRNDNGEGCESKF